MSVEGPHLEALTHRLQECPAAFLEAPRIKKHGFVSVPAVVADVVRSLAGDPLLRPDIRPIVALQREHTRNLLRLTLTAAWLLDDAWFREHGDLAEPARRFLCKDLAGMAELVDAEQFVTDPDRREELVRYTLDRLGFRPRGETKAQAQDRLTTLDSVERARVVRETMAAQERAREIREALRRKREAELAAAKPMRE